MYHGDQTKVMTPTFRDAAIRRAQTVTIAVSTFAVGITLGLGGALYSTAKHTTIVAAGTQTTATSTGAAATPSATTAAPVVATHAS